MERNSSSSPESATKACAKPVPVGKAATSPASTATRSSPRKCVPRPRSTTKISSSAMWAWRGEDCLPGGSPRVLARRRPSRSPYRGLARGPRTCPPATSLAAPRAYSRRLLSKETSFDLWAAVVWIGAYNKDLLAIRRLAANFGERRHGEVRSRPLLSAWVHNGVGRRAWVAGAPGRLESSNPKRSYNPAFGEEVSRKENRRHERVHQSEARREQAKRCNRPGRPRTSRAGRSRDLPARGRGSDPPDQLPRGFGRRVLHGIAVPAQLLRCAGGGSRHLPGKEVGLGSRILGRRRSVRGVRDQPYRGPARFTRRDGMARAPGRALSAGRGPIRGSASGHLRSPQGVPKRRLEWSRLALQPPTWSFFGG